MFYVHMRLPGWLCQELKLLIPSDMADLKVASNDFCHPANTWVQVEALTSDRE